MDRGKATFGVIGVVVVLAIADAVIHGRIGISLVGCRDLGVVGVGSGSIHRGGDIDGD